jgi:hypothetical protein
MATPSSALGTSPAPGPRASPVSVSANGRSTRRHTGLALLLAGFVPVLISSQPMFANLVRYLLRNLGSNACDGAGVIATSDVDIHFVSYGEGPPVLLLHGGLSNRLSWFSQIPWLVGAGR